ncbi:MAG: peptidyl-prolyl cis-trans isomerase [Betaproteobacteria bacterium]|nr:peptidyl-prolyl cis-trans isomerase [Betaproteobacteria bacterium]NBT11243.1 peptidyl-prolyl cis-trans isomerase [Betaproteobacteria bacterium]NBU50365.1 peptidyl-prolyl cis-trans isomerase [Betaproteobacteria bacterium]
MFDFVRDNTRLMLGLLVLLIIPSFIFFGIEGYKGFNGPENQKVASVAGQKITQAEWDAGHRQQVDNLRRQVPNLDASLFEKPEARYESLEQIVRQRVLQTTAQKQHLAVSDAQLQRELLTNPQLAALRRSDGSIDLDAYRALLSGQGYTPESYEAAVRQDLLLRQVLGRVGETTVASSAAADGALRVVFQERQIRLQRFQAADFFKDVNPTEAEVQAYYQRNQADFQTVEQADIEYVVLDAARVRESLVVSVEEARKFYQDNLANYTKPEERRASHILVKVDKGAGAEEKTKARARAQALLDEVRKAPKRFAEVAKAKSDDSGSAASGGDLDFFARGAMVKGFEDAVFAMKRGDISDLVETDFGLHIIQLSDVRGGQQQPFEAVRAEIETKLKQEWAQKRYTEAAEQFSNLVYEQSDSLKAAADRFKLPVLKATVTRQPAPGAQGPLASAKLLSAVFSDDALRNKRNTDAVESGPNQLVSARVVEHRPSVLKALDEVKAVALEKVRVEQALAKAREAGQARLAAVKAQASELDKFPPVIVSRPAPMGLPRELMDAILRAEARQLPAFAGVDLGVNGYAVVRIDAIKTPDIAAPIRRQWGPQLAQAYSAAESQLYYEALKKRLDVQMKVAKP